MDIKNFKSLTAAFILLLVGVGLAFGDCYHWHTESGFGTGIGYSLIASSLVTILNAVYVEYREKKAIDKWKLDKIYKTRSDKNHDSDPKLDSAVDRVDGIAFGLGTFRRNHTDKVRNCLDRGVNFRFITMAPDSEFVKQRSIEEGQPADAIAHSIRQFIDWAEKLNAEGHRGKISIKGYKCMTLDFYWRIDDEIYMGPYWYGYLSSQTVTYKFVRGGLGYEMYKDYFDRLWEDKELMTKLV